MSDNTKPTAGGGDDHDWTETIGQLGGHVLPLGGPAVTIDPRAYAASASVAPSQIVVGAPGQGRQAGQERS